MVYKVAVGIPLLIIQELVQRVALRPGQPDPLLLAAFLSLLFRMLTFRGGWGGGGGHDDRLNKVFRTAACEDMCFG